MKAAKRHSYGSPDIIRVEDVGIPQPNDNEVLIKVCATTINRTDCANLTAKPFIMRLFLGLIKPRRSTLGTDFSGRVISVGKHVNAFKVNDRLFGFNDLGMESQAEYMTVREDGNIMHIPSNISFTTAAASLEGAHYAYSFVHKVNIRSGQRILINGATGAIGSALLQFVKQYDVHITATCEANDSELVRTLGAHRTIDYTKKDFTEEKEKYDLVLDAVGKSTFLKCKSVLNKGGVYISSEPGPYAQNLFFALTTAIAGNKKVIFPIPFSIKRTMSYITDLLKEKVFVPLIDSEYSLENISKAYEFALSGKKKGNIILNLEIQDSPDLESDSE